MNCEEARRLTPDWLTHQLTPSDRTALDQHLTTCPACQAELAEARQLWHTLGQLPTPEPGPRLRADFYATLAQFQRTAAPTSSPLARLTHWLQDLCTPLFIQRLAFSLVLLITGAAIGFSLGRRAAPDPSQQQLATLSAEVARMRQVMMLSLLENPSATERLRAVGYTRDLHQANPKVVEALLSTLNHDPNPNVRLATLEALVRLADDASVRAGLVHAFAYQDSPLVLTALADVMVQLQEKRSVPQLRRLLRQPNLNTLVRHKLQHSLESLADGSSTTDSTPKTL